MRITTEDVIAEWLCKRYGSASFQRDGKKAIEAWRKDAQALMRDIRRKILAERIVESPERHEVDPEPAMTLGELLDSLGRTDG